MEKNKPTVPEIISKWNNLKSCEDGVHSELMDAMDAAESLLGIVASIKEGLDKTFTGDFPGNTGTASLHMSGPLQKSFELALLDGHEVAALGHFAKMLQHHLGKMDSDITQGFHKGWDGWYDEGGYDKG